MLTQNISGQLLISTAILMYQVKRIPVTEHILLTVLDLISRRRPPLIPADELDRSSPP